MRQVLTCTLTPRPSSPCLTYQRRFFPPDSAALALFLFDYRLVARSLCGDRFAGRLARGGREVS